MNRWDIRTLTDLRDKDIYTSDGKKVGSVKDIYYDETTQEPEWVGVGTGFLGMKERVIPVEQLSSIGDRLMLPFTKDRVEHEPDFQVLDNRISELDEKRLYEYFGLMGRESHGTRILRYGEDYRADL